MPNYSFEQYNTCPVGVGSQIFYADSWQNANVNGTADYYNACVTTTVSYFGVPSNWCGYQNAKTGNGYGGFYVKTMPNTTGQYEYIQATLQATLKPNYHYCVQFFVSRVEKRGDYAISNFGALFTNTVVNSSDPYNIQMVPQVKNQTGNFVVNRTIWAPISGTITAVGDEQNITIGNFDDPTLTDTLYDPVLPDDGVRNYGSIYYYIDDVTVEEVANAQAGIDKTINCGDSIVLGADSAIGAYYKWTPSIGLNNDSVAFPTANPTITTTYVLRKQQCSIITYDTVKVMVSNNCSTMGINELNINSAVTLQPNPTNGIINISSRYDFEKIELQSITGQTLLSETVNSKEHQLQLQNFAEGIYFVRVSYENGQNLTRKIIISR